MAVKIEFEVVDGKYFARSSSGIDIIGQRPENFAYFIRDEAMSDSNLELTYVPGMSSQLKKRRNVLVKL